MSRKFSLYALLATVVLIGVLFYQVIQPFIVSLLFAAVLAVLFQPFQQWLVDRLGKHAHMAASVATLSIFLLILIPIGGAVTLAGVQMAEVVGDALNLMKDEQEDSQLKENLKKLEKSQLATRLNDFYMDLSFERRKQFDKLVSQAADGFVKRVYEKTANLLGDLVNFVIGLLITGLALYYFLADGKKLLRQLKTFTPLSDEEMNTLTNQFGTVCRAVVLGTVVAALAQAVLAGIGFAIAGVPNVLFLMALTMFFAFIPFIGASSVVVLVCGWLAIEDRYGAAAALLIYCLAIIATSDNLIRAYVIGTEVKMNPLVALITVLGALQMIGLLGIFVGPMIAALFYTLLKLLRERIAEEQAETVVG